VRVIDFGQYLAGPLLARMLADHGADVVRADPSLATPSLVRPTTS
jgi:crotonobetainyl-CoA:carnitine CoA-transferase CaiB-like acyl-CoA transferase